MTTKLLDELNPESLPADKLLIPVTNEGIVRRVKALDPYWVEARELAYYQNPPTGRALVPGALDAWKLNMEAYLDDLQWLLGLDHHRFWSTVMYHEQCVSSLVSFIQEARPPYMLPYQNKQVEQLFCEIRRLVLIVFSRLITNKESKHEWMTKEYMADVLYKHFILTIPILWDICLMYGTDNSQHVSKILTSVYTLQPKYKEDAYIGVTYIREAFKFMILVVNKEYDLDEPPKLKEFAGFGDIRRPSDPGEGDGGERLGFTALRDIVIFLLDSAMTLRIFVEAHSDNVLLVKKANFVNSIVQIYEYGIPYMYDQLEEAGDCSREEVAEVQRYLDCARAELMHLYAEVLAVYKNAILSGEGNKIGYLEDFLATLMDALSERLFMRDYHHCHPVHEDIELLRQVCPELDSVKTDFILQAIYSNLLDEPVPEHLLTNGTLNGTVERYDKPGSSRPQPVGPQPVTNATNIPANNDTVMNEHTEALIKEVKDVLPNLGDGFILKCLEHYEYNTENVFNALFDDNLAEPLKGVDKTLPIIPEDPLDKHFLETGVERLNVFDGDEFDIMTRDDVDVTRIHVGKRKSKYKDLKAMLEDKTEVKKMMDIYNKYNLVCDEEAMYSDEYDDTYDSDGVAPAADTADEPRRAFVTPRVLADREPRAQREESEEESEVEEEKPERNRADFCVNPEELRARRAAQAGARRGRAHRPAPPARSADVTGRPRGQGQEKEVLVNRDRKEKHKSSRANHNRRQGAQHKRNQGMMS